MTHRPGPAAVAPVLVAVIALAWVASVGAPDAAALPGLLWGRFAVEEESPDGSWTPLTGVEVSVYPFAPEVLSDLDRIRGSARDSAGQFESAVGRVRERLNAYAAQLDRGVDRAGQTGGRRQVTDAAGVFVFEGLPSGEWLLVAIRVTPYASAPGDRKRASGAGSKFLPRSSRGDAEQAELWVTRVGVAPGSRTRLTLTDRARWLVGPVR